MKAKLEEMMLGNKGAAKEMMQRHSRLMLGKRDIITTETDNQLNQSELLYSVCTVKACLCLFLPFLDPCHSQLSPNVN